MKKTSMILAIFSFLLLAGASCNNSNSNGTVSSGGDANAAEPSVASSNSSDTAEYFSEDAKVMFFYSDYCGWCVKEKDVLKEIAPEGYKVKPMNVGENQSMWQEYSIEGTPTFIAPDGTKLVGYQDKDKLKEFLNKYK